MNIPQDAINRLNDVNQKTNSDWGIKPSGMFTFNGFDVHIAKTEEELIDYVEIIENIFLNYTDTNVDVLEILNLIAP
jgi:hypothetical protein